MLTANLKRWAAVTVAATLAGAGLVGCGGGSSRSPTAGDASTNAQGSAMVRPEMIGTNRQLAVRNECWYALNKDWISKANDNNGPSNTKSNWAYLSPAADQNSNALRYALTTYNYNISWLLPDKPKDKIPSNQIENYVSQLSSNGYALGLTYQSGKNSGYGHGCQCVSFVSMILYRALNGYRFSWNWSNPALDNINVCPSAVNAQPGDIVFYKGSPSHIGICVRNYGTGITVVDSNFVSGGDPQEVIGRHDVDNGTLNQKWRVYFGHGWN